MIYTDNYQLRKPVIGVDNADVGDLNYNSDRIDAIMHASQVSLADAYDQTATYNTGDVVMYEFLMYKCKEDNVTGNWDASKWERTTAAETGGGEVDFDLYGEASGNPASFADGSASALVECEVEFEPVQDLHGYSKPWPGGANTNLFGGLYNQEYALFIASGTTLTASCKLHDGDSTRIVYYDQNHTQIDYWQISGTNPDQTRSKRSFTVNQDAYYFKFYYAECEDMVIEKGTTDGNFSPYANICPITGYDEITILRTGFNIWDEEWEQGTYNGTTGAKQSSTSALRNKNPILVDSNLSYFVKFSSVITSSNNVIVFYYDEDMTYLGNGQVTNTNPDKILPDIPQTTRYINFRWIGSTYSDNICINVSNASKDGTYEAYNGAETTIQLGDTYYRGTLNAVNGELTVTYGYIESYNGETLTGEWLSDRDEYTSGGTPTTGAEVVYELATPIMVQIPPTVINTLLGQNYISSEDTEDIDLVYTKSTAPIKPNPSGTPSGELRSIDIGGEIFEIIKELPTFPSSDGDYKLKLSVSSGEPTLSWVSDT